MDYLSAGLTLFKSVKLSSRNLVCFCFIIDAPKKTIQELVKNLGKEYKHITFFGYENLSIYQSIFIKSMEYYNGLEISCLAKWVGSAHVLNTFNINESVFVDSDIWFYQDISPFLNKLSKNTLIVTPHQTNYIETKIENEYDTLFHGYINSGFFSIKKNGSNYNEIMNWMINRVSKMGFLAPHAGMSGDQLWLSLAVNLFEDVTHVSKDISLNVAYWNLHERELLVKDGVFLISQKNLMFFHFSGFSAKSPQKLSSYDKLKISKDPLLTICKDYSQQLLYHEKITIKINDLATKPINKSGLYKRIKKAYTIQNIDLKEAIKFTGFFARVGQKIDSYLNFIFIKKIK